MDRADKHIPTEPSPLKELLALALPTVLQMATYTLMAFIDRWFLSRVGDVPATAAMGAGMIAFSFMSFGFGVNLCVNALASQDYGRKDFAHCGRYLWQGIWFSLLYGVAMLPLVPWVSTWFAAFGHPADMVVMEKQYLHIAMSLTGIKLLQLAMGQFLLAINRPTSLLYSAVTGVAVNAVAAWIMILGKLGCPQLGVVGAAWAQIIGQTVEMLVVMTIVFSPKVREQFGTTSWRLYKKEFWELMRVGAGAGVQTVVDVAAWTAWCVWVMARIGETAMAANQYVFGYMHVSFMPAVGISHAITALVGRSVGAKQPDKGVKSAHLGFMVCAIYMVFCAFFYITFGKQLIEVFSVDPQVIKVGATLMIFAGAYQFFDAMYIAYAGALRGAGDTLVPAIVMAGLCWGITVFGGYLMTRYVPAMGATGPWSAAFVYGILLGLFMLTRFKRGKWKTRSLAHPPTGMDVEHPIGM